MALLGGNILIDTLDGKDNIYVSPGVRQGELIPLISKVIQIYSN